MARSKPMIRRNFIELDNDINGVFKSAYDGDLNACIDYINNNENAINDLQSEIHKYSLLELAVRNNHYCLSKNLIELGADVNYKDAEGRSILYIAVTWNKKTKEEKAKGWKENTDIELIELLINNGANVNDLVGYNFGNRIVSLLTISLLRIYDGMDPLCDMDIPRILLKNGANPNVGWSFIGPTLHLLVQLCLKYEGKNLLTFDPLFLFFYVLKSGAGVSVDSLNKDNETPLFCAMKHCNYKLAMFLVLQGARVRFVCNGRAPYDFNPIIFKELFYHRRRNILLMRRHDDYETNKEHHPTKLAELIMDNLDIKRQIASFL